MIAIASWRMSVLTPEVEDALHQQQRQISMAMLLVSSGVCAAWSLVDPRQAILADTLHLATPTLLRLVAARNQQAK